MKQFYISDQTFDNQIEEIRRKIKLSMNGVVSDSMTNSGLIYAKNYGVSFPRLKEISQSYTKNHDLAQRLWKLQIRETMILGILLEPEDKFSIDNAMHWISEISNMEQVEQLCLNLLNKLDFAKTLCHNCLLSNQLWFKITGFVLAARIYNQFRPDEIKFILNKAFELLNDDESRIYRSISLCLSRFCRIDRATQTTILEMLTAKCTNNTIAENHIVDEVNNEIKFLNS